MISWLTLNMHTGYTNWKCTSNIQPTWKPWKLKTSCMYVLHAVSSPQVKFPANGFLRGRALKELAKLLPAPEPDEPMDVDEDLEEVSSLCVFVHVYMWVGVCGYEH